MSRPDPMADAVDSDTIHQMDQETLVDKLSTSIATSKIQLEQERIRLLNLELHQNLETPARYTEYASRLEMQYLIPTSQSVEDQRRTVDGINATRMEEQNASIGKLDGLTRRYEELLDKNRKLGMALGGLEGEVLLLRGNNGDASKEN